MNEHEVNDNGNITGGRLTQKWASLMDNGFQYTESKQGDLMRWIRRLTG